MKTKNKSDKNATALSKIPGSFFGYLTQMRTCCLNIACKSLYFSAVLSRLLFLPGFYYFTILLFYNSIILHCKLKENREMPSYEQSLLMSLSKQFHLHVLLTLRSYFPCSEKDDDDDDDHDDDDDNDHALLPVYFSMFSSFLYSWYFKLHLFTQNYPAESLYKIHRSFHSVADLNGPCRLLQIYSITAPKKLNTTTIKKNK